MKTVLYVLLLLLVLAAFGGGIYYLVTQVDYSGVNEAADSAVSWFDDKLSYVKGLFD